MMDWGLRDKTVLVTGASSVLGQCITIALAKEGANMVLHYNDSTDKIKSLTNVLSGLGCDYRLIKADFSNPAEISDIFLKLRDWKCNIDVLINNASIHCKKNIVYMNIAQYEKIMSVNLKAPYILCKNMLREMIVRKRGIIVNISSSITKRSRVNESVYGMTKGGVEAMTRLLANEAGAYNVRVNCIAPGPFVSPMNELDSESKKEIIKSSALKDIVTPEEIANVILFLCSDYSSAITGQVFNVDNGFEI